MQNPIYPRSTTAAQVIQVAWDELFPSGVSRSNDLGSIQQVADYANPQIQRQYTHMYAAKHIAAWQSLRNQLGWNEGPLYSVGAGPGLDAFGWCWDTPWNGPITLIDPLSWYGVTQNPLWQALTRFLLGTHQRLNQHYIPDRAIIPQLSHLPGLTGFAAHRIPDRATLLMPFVLNHFCCPQGMDQLALAALVGWLHHVTRRGCRVAIVDMYGGIEQVWRPFLTALGVSTLPAALDTTDALADLRGLYPEEWADYRTYARAPKHGQVRALIFDTHWRSL